MWDATNVTSNNFYLHLKFKKILKIRLNRTPKTENVDSKKKKVIKIARPTQNNSNVNPFI